MRKLLQKGILEAVSPVFGANSMEVYETVEKKHWRRVFILLNLSR